MLRGEGQAGGGGAKERLMMLADKIGQLTAAARRRLAMRRREGGSMSVTTTPMDVIRKSKNSIKKKTQLQFHRCCHLLLLPKLLITGLNIVEKGSAKFQKKVLKNGN